MSVPSESFVLRPGWLLPLGEVDVAPPGSALVVRGRRIEQVLAPGAMPPADLPLLDLPGHVVLPGLVNAHGHLAMSLLRGLADDYRLETWLNDHIWPAEGRWVGPEFVADGTELAAAEMIRCGTTCCSDMYFFPEVSAAVLSRMGMRSQVAAPIIRFPNAWSNGADAAIHQTLELLDRFRDDPLCNIAFGPHSAYVLEADTLARIATLAEEVGRPVQIHLQETATEVRDYLAQHGRTPLAHLGELGLLGPNLQAVHLTQVAPGEIDVLARHGVSVVHCPQSNMRLGSGTCPVQDLRAAGVTVALGTDGAASNNGLDLFRELNVALLLAKSTHGDPTALRALDALRMATIGGARALGLEADIGSLEPGKRADIIAVDLSAPAQQPVYDPVSQLAYTGVGGCVRHAWIDGVPRLVDGALPGVDIDDLTARARRWAARIKGGTQA